MNHEKKLIKPIKVLKKRNGSVRFYKPETEKTKPKPEKNRKKNLDKPSQNRKN